MANDDELLSLVGARIAELRENLGLRQGDVAERLDIALKNYQRLERGGQNLTLRSLARIAQALETEVADLFVIPRPRERKRGRPKRSRARAHKHDMKSNDMYDVGKGRRSKWGQRQRQAVGVRASASGHQRQRCTGLRVAIPDLCFGDHDRPRSARDARPPRRLRAARGDSAPA